MQDLFAAIEQLSAVLAMRLERAAHKRGWPCKSGTRAIAAGRGRQVHLISLMVSLPQGVAATFTPRPEPDGERWFIDVRRSDGVMRRSWQDGLHVARIGGPDGRFMMRQGDGLLTDEGIVALLDDLAKPAPTGVALWVRKVWAIRFGRLPLDISEVLDRVKDADVLDQMHAAVLRAIDADEAAALLKHLAQ